MKYKWRNLAVFTGAFLLLFGYINNNLLTTTVHNVKIPGLPSTFKGFRIVQLSDVHSKSFGKNQKRLLKTIHNQSPDIIVITGDLIDRRRYEEDRALFLLESLVEKYPVYYVPGNHEFWSGHYQSLKVKIEALGVTVLGNKKDKVTRDGEHINLIGLDDPAAYYAENSKESDRGYEELEKQLSSVMQSINDEEVSILLSHRPDAFSIYQRNHVDLTFSGHAHGGQVRLPFIGGLVGPNQGLFPEYDGGLYEEEGAMIVSRGLGNSLFPMRVFNLPEVVVAQLE